MSRHAVGILLIAGSIAAYAIGLLFGVVAVLCIFFGGPDPQPNSSVALVYGSIHAVISLSLPISGHFAFRRGLAQCRAVIPAR